MMSNQQRWVRAPTPHPVDPRRPGPARPDPAAVFRSLLLGAIVFTFAAATGGVLAGSGSAGRAEPAVAATGDWVAAVTAGDWVVARSADDPDPAVTADDSGTAMSDPVFASSMIYTGVAALAVSVVGMVLVARRRRLW